MEFIHALGHGIQWAAATLGYLAALLFGLCCVFLAGTMIETKEWGMSAVMAVIGLVLLRAGNVI